jgi:hypothetical protein
LLLPPLLMKLEEKRNASVVDHATPESATA